MADIHDALRAGIRAERSRIGLTQAGLADRLGWVRTRVTKIEAGDLDVTARDLPAICAALGVTLDRLLLDADPDVRRTLGL